MSHSPERKRPRDTQSRRYIYTITGPTCVYVGCTHEPEKRRHAHWLAAAARRGKYERCFPIHRAMRADGLGAYSFAVVASARNRADGEATEYAVIRQLRADCLHVLNVHPRDELTAARERLLAELVAAGHAQRRTASPLPTHSPEPVHVP